MPDNVRAGRPDGKRHRNYTTETVSGVERWAFEKTRMSNARHPLCPEMVKWCGKSAPAMWRHVGQASPIGSKARQERLTWLADSPGEPHEEPGNRLPREMTAQTQNPAYRPPHSKFSSLLFCSLTLYSSAKNDRGTGYTEPASVT